MRKLTILAIILCTLCIEKYFYAINNHVDTDTTTYQFGFNSDPTSETQIFQPADGSLDNGWYSKKNDRAKTILNTYKNIIIVDGTENTPKLNSTGKYMDPRNMPLEPVGSFSLYSDDTGNTSIYYLFGTLMHATNEKNRVNNKPIQTYSSLPD
jgi:hypothetical protein